MKNEKRGIILDGTDAGGYIVFTDNEFSFYPDFTSHPEVHLPAETIQLVDIQTSDTRESRLTVTRLFFLKWLAFALPKQSGGISSSLTIGTDTQTLSFIIDDIDSESYWRELAPFLNMYNIETVR